MNAYTAIFIQLVVTATFASIAIFASGALGKKGKSNALKNQSYECGLPEHTQTVTLFPIRFHLVAALFILFDVEVAFLIPWAVIYRDCLQTGLPIIASSFTFLALLAIGIYHELKKHATTWQDAPPLAPHNLKTPNR